MRWTSLGTIVLATIVLPPVMTTAAHAQEYKWCAVYTEMDATNCGFTTFRQCMATVSGVGGFCERNPAYTGDGSSSRNYDRRRRRDR